MDEGSNISMQKWLTILDVAHFHFWKWFFELLFLIKGSPASCRLVVRVETLDQKVVGSNLGAGYFFIII